MSVYFLGWKAHYEILMIENLARNNDVRVVKVPAYAKKIVRAVRSISKRSGVNLPLDWLARRIWSGCAAKADDLLVCNEGQARRGLNPRVIANFPGTRVLLVRDLVDAAFIDNVRPLFDRIYSYDPVQCEQLDMAFLDQFFPFNVETARQGAEEHIGEKPLCFFLGRDKGRAARLSAVADQLIADGCDIDFSIVRDHTSTHPCRYHTDAVLPYEQNLAKALSAQVLVEINQPGQSGLTLRPLEAAFFDKKLITDNQRVKTLEFYHPDRFYVLGDEQRDLKQFLTSQAPPVPAAALRKHSPQGLIDRLLCEACT